MADPVLKVGMTNEEYRAWQTYVSARITAAIYEAQQLRPYWSDETILKALKTPGGDWQIVADPGAVTRSIRWRGKEVALLNPRGDLTDGEEADIAGGMGRSPVMDYALRAIITLSQHPANSDLVRRIAMTAITHVESRVCPIPEPEEE